MYVFSVSAMAKETVDGIAEGQNVPCIIYINAPKKEGAEKLCILQLLRAGFHRVILEKHKKIAPKVPQNAPKTTPKRLHITSHDLYSL